MFTPDYNRTIKCPWCPGRKFYAGYNTDGTTAVWCCHCEGILWSWEASAGKRRGDFRSSEAVGEARDEPGDLVSAEEPNHAEERWEGEGGRVRMTWYVVCDESAFEPADDERLWTLSRDPTKTGWNTDGGYPGYGLTKADAQKLADAANKGER